MLDKDRNKWKLRKLFYTLIDVFLYSPPKKNTKQPHNMNIILDVLQPINKCVSLLKNDLEMTILFY